MWTVVCFFVFITTRGGTIGWDAMTVRAARYGSTSITGVDELWRITAIGRATSQCIFIITLVFVN